MEWNRPPYRRECKPAATLIGVQPRPPKQVGPPLCALHSGNPTHHLVRDPRADLVKWCTPLGNETPLQPLKTDTETSLLEARSGFGGTSRPNLGQREPPGKQREQRRISPQIDINQ